jgi:hypothetical protein
MLGPSIGRAPGLYDEFPVALAVSLERAMGFEPTTSSLGSWHSTAELRPQVFHFQALVSSVSLTGVLDVPMDVLHDRARQCSTSCNCSGPNRNRKQVRRTSWCGPVSP